MTDQATKERKSRPRIETVLVTAYEVECTPEMEDRLRESYRILVGMMMEYFIELEKKRSLEKGGNQ